MKDPRQQRKFDLESLLHHIEGPERIAKAHRAACPEPEDDDFVGVPPKGVKSLREMIEEILDAEFPPAGAITSD